MTPSKKSRLVATPTLLSPALLFVLVIFTARTLPAQQVDFSKEVLPVLKANCFKWHGE